MGSQIERQIKKSKNKNDVEGDPTNCFNRLPSELVNDILSRLPITSLIQSTFVCKTLQPLSHDQNLVNMHFSQSSTNESLCLILHSDYPIRNQLHFLQFPDEKVRKIDIPAAMCMSEFRILGSSNGLLCLLNTMFPESMYLFNPFTRDYFALPKSFEEAQDQVILYGFGSHPVTNDYKVIKIVHYTINFFRRLGDYFPEFNHYFRRRMESEVKIYSLRSNMWKNGGQIPHRLETWSSPGILSNGRLHWMSTLRSYNPRAPLRRTIVSHDLADDSLHEMYSPFYTRSTTGTVMCYLSTLEGSLCAYVPMEHGALDIWVMKEYGVSESWVKEYSIGSYIPVSVSTSRETGRATGLRRNWRSTLTKELVKVLCVLESGEVLLEYRKRGLVCYDPCQQAFKKLTYRGMPRSYHPFFHVGSLKSAALP